MPELKGYQLVISKRAASQLNEHTAFAARLEERLAQRLIQSFQEAAISLKHMPYRMPFLISDTIPDKKYRKMLFEKYYLLLYKVEDDTVYIEYVLEGRQDYHWLLS